MGKQSKKINKYRVDEISKSFVKVRPADDSGMTNEDDADISVFIVDGKPWVKVSEVVKSIGKQAMVRGAVRLLEMVGFRKNKDYWVTTIDGLTGKHAVMPFEKIVPFLDKLNVSFLKPELYEFYSVRMKTDLRKMMDELPIADMGGYTLRNGRLIATHPLPDEQTINNAVESKKKPEPVAEIKHEGTDIRISKKEMELISQNIMTQAKAMTVLAEEIKQLRKDRADMAAMIDYQNKDLRKIKVQVEQLYLDLH